MPMTQMTPEHVKQVQDLLIEFQDVFSTGDFDIGKTTTVKHRVDLKDETPFKQRHRRIPPSMYQEVKDHLQELLGAGISPPASGLPSPSRAAFYRLRLEVLFYIRAVVYHAAARF